jgi:glycosyltransferase involved in cell wall biosynthesis
MTTDISVIIPFLNEEDNINDLCNTLEDYAKDKEFRLEIVFVDDGSIDRSVMLLKQYDFKYTKAKIITLSRNFGSHAAIRAGVLKSSSDICVFFSADLQEPVSLIGNVYEKLKEGYDLVSIQKREVKVSFGEKLFSRAYAKLIRKYAVKNFPLGGLNNIMFNKKVKDVLNAYIESNSSIFLQIMNMGFKMSIVDMDYNSRNKGESKWTLDKKIKMFIDSFVAFSFFPIRMVSVLGIIMSLLGLLFSFGILVIKLFHIIPLALGYPTLITVILFGFGITNISLGIIAEYLWRAYDSARGRAVFIINEEITVN